MPYVCASHTLVDCLCHLAAGLGCTQTEDSSTESLPAPPLPPLPNTSPPALLWLQIVVDNAQLLLLYMPMATPGVVLCRQASGSGKGQPDAQMPTMLQTRPSVSAGLPAHDRNLTRSSHSGALGTPPSSSERPWPSQQTHANTFSHNSPGLSTVPEAQQQPAAAPSQSILRARSLQTQRSLQQPGGNFVKQRMNRAQSGLDPNLPAERVRWSDAPVMSNHF